MNRRLAYCVRAQWERKKRQKFLLYILLLLCPSFPTIYVLDLRLGCVVGYLIYIYILSISYSYFLKRERFKFFPTTDVRRTTTARIRVKGSRSRYFPLFKTQFQYKQVRFYVQRSRAYVHFSIIMLSYKSNTYIRVAADQFDFH